MKKNVFKLKILKISKTLSYKELIQITNLIKKENDYSILSKLSTSLIKKYLQIAINSKNMFLFVLKKKNEIIGYALFTKNEDSLIKDFESIKFKIFIYLFFTLKFFSLFNIFLAITKLDLILLNNKVYKKKKLLNLNLLAINKIYQSKGYGNMFLTKTIKTIYSRMYKFSYITCEAPSLRALNFYTQKKKFRLIGKKIRIKTNLYVLVKNFNEI